MAQTSGTSSEKRPIRIVVDAMGGDFAPLVNIKGALMALEASSNVSTILVGDENRLRAELKKDGNSENNRLSILHADEVITMEDHAAAVIRRKSNSSIHVGLRLLKDHKADAFISAGHSGAVMATALVVLGRLGQVERPAILVKLPTAEGHVIILDAGANVECRPSHLVQFAEMGSIFAKTIEGVERPKVAILSNGTEAQKGNDLTRAAQEELKQNKNVDYIGYIEGNHLFQGGADVVVCDGFTGNIALKIAEGVAGTAFDWFRKEVKRDLMGLVGVAFLRRILGRFKERFDYEPYGAANLVGVDGTVLISHGGSSEVAIRNGILKAVKTVEQNFNHKIREQLERAISLNTGKPS